MSSYDNFELFFICSDNNLNPKGSKLFCHKLKKFNLGNFYNKLTSYLVIFNSEKSIQMK